MPYTPPLIKPLLPPLQPRSVPFPFRPPVVSPPTQIAPIYQPPDLVPPTGLDLKGDVCIYSNPPIWEPKKIRYKYPGESWQEIAGERYTSELSNIAGGDSFATWIIDIGKIQSISNVTYFENFWPPCSGNTSSDTLNYTNIFSTEFTGKITKISQLDAVIGNCGSVSPPSRSLARPIIIEFIKEDGAKLTIDYFGTQFVDLPIKYGWHTFTGHKFSIQFRKKDELPSPFPCTFKVFNIFNQEILNLTRNTCPEVLIIPERCYYKAENEKLASKVNLGFGQSLKIEYNANCATVLLYSYPFPIPIQVYKECSDNPNCPPPKIRFDKKCEKKEKCEQCPKGTAAKVLIGLTIACVDKNGCIKKIIKYKPGCNTYDCVC